MQKYLIISDIHDNLANLAVLAQKEPPENLSGLIVAGDICAWDTVKHIQKLFPIPTWLVAGNGDHNWPAVRHPELVEGSLHFGRDDGHGFVFQKCPFIFQINNFNIGLAHEPDQAKDLTYKNPNLDYVIFGHTHLPTIETWGATMALNSGNLAGIRTPATYATLDLSIQPPKFELHRLFSTAQI